MVGSWPPASPRQVVLRQQAASSPLSGPLQDLGEDRRAALVDDLAERPRAHTDDDGVVFPMEAWILTAHR